MSDDLISRKALLKQFILSDSGRRIPEYDIDNFPITLSIKDAKDIIRKAPTVFDKDFDKEKVIEQIKVLSAGIILNTNICDDYAEGYVRAAKDIIEIIEKGGIE